MTAAVEFEIGDVLSMMTGRLVSRAHMDGIYRIAAHLTGGPVWTHQLPRVVDEAKDRLRAQFPDLAAVDIPDDPGPDGWLAWLESVEATHGRTRMVEPLAADDHTVIDPISELQMMKPGLQVIAIEIDGDVPPNAGSTS